MMNSMEIENELIKAISRKFEGKVVEKDFSLSDLLHTFGKGSEALLYSILYMPKLNLIDDSVLLSWNMPNNSVKKKFSEQLQCENREELEASYNFIEIGYLFDAVGRDTSDKEDNLLATLVRDAWDAWLHLKYPDRKFKVEILAPEQTGSVTGIHFFERRA